MSPALAKPMTIALADPLAQAAPALDRCTDPASMRELLQRHLPGFSAGELRIDAVGICKVRRNTSLHRNPCAMTLCYVLDVTEPATGRQGTQHLYAKVFRPGLSAAHHVTLLAMFRAAPRGSPLVPPAFGQALVHVPALDLVAWALPNDPQLPQLATLLGAGAAGVFPWAALGLAPGGADRLDVELLRYEPEHRATLRYRTRPDAGSAAHEVYVKTFRDDRARDIYAHFNHFARRADADAQAPLVARPLAHDAATRTVWQAAASGAPWLPCVVGRPGADGAAAAAHAAAATRSAAHALATLHATPLVPSARARTAAHWVAEAKRREQKIARAVPRLAALAGSVAAAIGAGAGRVAARRPSLIHGDFHPDQLWLHEGRIVLFDFDEFALGDPMEDVAEFVIKLEQAGAHASVVRGFVDAYVAAAPDRFDGPSLAWHLAVQSLLQASRAFVYQQPGWQGELEHRLASAAARAAVLAPRTA